MSEDFILTKNDMNELWTKVVDNLIQYMDEHPNEAKRYKRLFYRGLTKEAEADNKIHVGPTGIVYVCYDIIGTSLAEYIFNEPAEVPLTRRQRLFITMYNRLDDEEKRRVKDYMVRSANRLGDSNAVLRRRVFRRICEMANHRNCAAKEMIMFDDRYTVSYAIASWYSKQSAPGNLPLFMYIAKACNIPIDYLLVQDYTRYCRVYEWEQDGSKRYLDEAETEMLSLWLCQADDTAGEIITDIYR